MQSRRNSSGTSSQDSIRCSSATKSKVYWADWEKHQKISQEEFFSCRCSTTFPVEQERMNMNVWQTLDSYLCMQENLVKGNGHSLVLVPKRSGILWKKTVHKESGTNWQKKERCWLNSKRADVQFSVQQLHCPGVSSKAKDMVNCRFTLQPFRKQLRLFRIIVSAHQLSLLGAVAEMCEEYETLHDRSGRPDVVMGQSIVVSAIKTEVSLEWWSSISEFSIAATWRTNQKSFTHWQSK